jgi:tripartite-type tricarboxylate transporter receptor subunit TctC
MTLPGAHEVRCASNRSDPDGGMMPRRGVVERSATLLVMVLAGITMPAAALGQDYPVKSIRWLVPYSPGGTSDFIARLIGQKLTEAWKQTVVVENRGGANGNIGTEIVAKAPPDGYTLLLVARALTINQSLYPNLPFDAEKDFAPVTTILWQSLVLTVHPSLPVKSVKELIALARARPAELNYSSGGSGNVNHIAAELFQSMAGVKLTHVPYKSMAPGISALLQGEVQLTFTTLVSVAPHFKSGRIRAIGVSSRERNAALPDVPTISEAGVPGYEEGSWVGVLVPAQTPRPIVTRLNREIVRILKTPEVHEQISRSGADVVANTPEEFAAIIRADVKKYAALIKSVGTIRLD